VHLELIKESERRSEQALVNLFCCIGVQDTDTATSHEGVCTISVTSFDGAEQTFLLRTNQLAGGLNTCPKARFSNHKKLHWNYLPSTGISGFEILIVPPGDDNSAVGKRHALASPCWPIFRPSTGSGPIALRIIAFAIVCSASAANKKVSAVTPAE